MSKLAGVKIHLPHGSTAKALIKIGNEHMVPGEYGHESFTLPRSNVQGEIIFFTGENGELVYKLQQQDRNREITTIDRSPHARATLWLSGVEPATLRVESFGTTVLSQSQYGEFDLHGPILVPGSAPLYYERFGCSQSADLNGIRLLLFSALTPERVRTLAPAFSKYY